MTNSISYLEERKNESRNNLNKIKQNEKIHLKISYAPDFSKNNPYQKQLYDELERLGVQLEGIDRQKIFLPTALKGKETDILHLHWLHSYFYAPSAVDAFLKLVKFISGLLILKLRGTKVIWTVHNLKNHENLRPLLDRTCTSVVSRLADAIITHSYAAKTELCQVFHVTDTEKVFVIPHGNYIEAYENNINQQEARKLLEIPESSIVFLFFGMIRWYKGVEELIDAFEEMHSENTYLVIAGSFKHDGKELADLIKKKVKNNRNIKLVPNFVPEEDVQTYMNACDVVLFPYRKLLTSGALILAMSFRRACVAPKIGCMDEILNDTGGFLYDPSSHDGLVRTLESVVQKKDDLIEMGEHNYQLATEWSRETVGQMTLDVYRQCMKGR